MNKLINEVKKEIANRAVELEKAKIKQMLKLIKSKEQDLKVIKEEITTLKEQLEKGDYSAVSSNGYTIEVFGSPPTYPFINRRANRITTSSGTSDSGITTFIGK